MIFMKTTVSHEPPSPAAVSGALVCGTDLSPRSDDAIEVAAGLARRLAAPLVLAHAVHLPRALLRDATATRWIVANRKRSLRTVAEEVRAPDLEVIERVLIGRPDEMLAEAAATEQARMIVVSAARNGVLERGFRRSVAKRTARRATSPTLILRGSEPWRAWLRGERPLKVFVCFAFTGACEAALRWVKQLAAAGPLEVVLGCLNHGVDAHLPIEAVATALLEMEPRSVVTEPARDMNARAHAALQNLSVRYRMETPRGRTSVCLVEMATDEGADLIVTGSNRDRGFQPLWRGSVSRGVLGRASTSVAVVRLPRTNGRAFFRQSVLPQTRGQQMTSSPEAVVLQH